MSGLGFAAQKAGVDFDGVVVGARHLQRVLSEAAGGSKVAQEALAKLGINAQDLIDKPLDEQMQALADGIAALPNPADQAAAAMNILGRSGVNLLPILRQGGAGLKAMAAEAEGLGLIISTEDAAKAKEWSKAVSQAKGAIMGLKEALGASLLAITGPAKQASDTFVGIVKGVRGWVDENRQLVFGVAAVGAALIVAGGALLALAGGITAAVFVVGALGTAASAVGAVLAFVFSPVGLGIATIGVAVVALTALAAEMGLLDGAADSLGKAWSFLSDTFGTTWQGIKDALAAGDLALALKVAGAGIKVVWFGLMAELRAAFDDVTQDMRADLERLREETEETARQIAVAEKGKNAAVGGAYEVGARLGFGQPPVQAVAGAGAGAADESVRAIADYQRQATQRMAEEIAKLGTNIFANLGGKGPPIAGAVLEATEAMRAAKAELAGLAEAAKLARLAMIAGRLAQLGLMAMLGQDRKRVAANVAELAGVRGQFGGGGLGQALAVGDQSIPKKQLEALEGIDDKLGRMEKNAGGLRVE
jgi:hypothetical protein